MWQNGDFEFGSMKRRNGGSAGRESYDLVEPRASALIESLRAFGYNLRSAVADLIDNSITAGDWLAPGDGLRRAQLAIV
jgi:hypothetical protein